MTSATPRPLLRILGLAFGLALVFGTMVGVGILRLPGAVAAAFGSPILIMSAWVFGGVFALMCAVSIAELAAMIPDSGGFRVYARRAFGEGTGFVIGCVDWLSSPVTIALGAVTAVAFLGILWPPLTNHSKLAASVILVIFTGLHWAGIRVGNSITQGTSAAMGLLFIVLLVCCFVVPVPVTVAAHETSRLAAPALSFAMLAASIPAIRAILTAYDGYYAPIYMAEENTNASSTLPRAIIGGTLLVVGLYLAINLAFLHVLPVAVLAASTLPAADAARAVLPRGSAEFVTVLSLLTVMSLISNNMLYGSRILFAFARDGFLSGRVAQVSHTGTPRMALEITAAAGLAMIMTGTFEQILALFAIVFLTLYVSAFLAVFVLRRREPRLLRPYRAFAYPVSSAIALLGSIALLAGAIADDPRSAKIGAVFLVGCALGYWTLARRRRVPAIQPITASAS